MAARSIARVVVSMGLSQVGIKLFLSAKSEQVGFNMINAKTGHRVKQILVDEDDYDAEAKTLKKAQVIPRNETVKGFEYAKGQYVTFTDEEIANMAAEKRDTIDITEFVPVSEIDPLHVEKTFYTGPDKGNDKGYSVLYRILSVEGKAAVGTWVSRGKEHLVTIRAYDHGLIMHQMFYDKEVRSFENLCSNVDVTPAELAMSKLLVDHMSKDTFDKSVYSDKFVDKVTNAVEIKRDGGEITTAQASKVPSSNVEAALRKSLEQLGIPESKIEETLKAQGLVQSKPEPAKKAAPAKKPTKKRASAKKSRKASGV